MYWREDAGTAQAWAAVGGPPKLLRSVVHESAGPVLPSRLPVRELGRATVAACSLAAAELLARRQGTRVPDVHVHDAAVATAFRSERALLIDGRAPTSFAPLSGFWRAADGWVRTHANYPHHRDRLLGALAVSGGGGADHEVVPALAEALADRPALDIQEAVYAAGGLAIAVAPAPSRSSGGAQLAGTLSDAAAVRPGAAGPAAPPDAEPIVQRQRAGLPASSPTILPPGAGLPADGVRILDLTRVIAGPVATRTLALLGADVLRVDPPGIPEDHDTHADTGMGKRSALLDLASPTDRRTFDGLLATADVVVTGYRPGALDRFGLAPDALLDRRPDLIIAQLNAWGWSVGTPWEGRRGFDSLVQAGSGIAAIEAADGRPGALPAQALDHGTGYLLAAAVLRALTERADSGRGCHLRFSLAATASWLLHGLAAGPVIGDDPGSERWLAETDAPIGRLRHALPPIRYSGAQHTWQQPTAHWGTDRAAWR